MHRAAQRDESFEVSTIEHTNTMGGKSTIFTTTVGGTKNSTHTNNENSNNNKIVVGKQKSALLHLDRARLIKTQGSENKFPVKEMQQPSYAVSITKDMIENATDNFLLNNNNSPSPHIKKNNNNTIVEENKIQLCSITHLNLRYTPMGQDVRNPNVFPQVAIATINAQQLNVLVEIRDGINALKGGNETLSFSNTSLTQEFFE